MIKYWIKKGAVIMIDVNTKYRLILKIISKHKSFTTSVTVKLNNETEYFL